MKQFLFLFFTFSLFLGIHAQPPPKTKAVEKKYSLTEASIVKDSSGTVYPAEIWKKLMMTGYYYIKAENSNDKNTSFLLVRRTEEEKEKILTNSAKPKESKSFTTGKEVKSFTTTDINGKKYKLKDLKGKIVVLNFWFINCPPCRLEIPALNNLVSQYKDSANIVFLAIALDNKYELESFLKTSPFYYKMIDSGRDIASQYNITSYPTHLVIDQSGKAFFHTTGAGSTTIYWLKKSIEELIKPATTLSE